MFQYSLANLVWCNIEAKAYATTYCDVSVFSGESRVVQRNDCAGLPSVINSFSILWRISCGATKTLDFHVATAIVFQYSLANLVWCNTPATSSNSALSESFSILWRILCGATIF